MENLIFLQNNQTGDRGALMYIRYIKTILLNFCGFFEITFELSFELIVAEVFKINSEHLVASYSPSMFNN